MNHMSLYLGTNVECSQKYVHTSFILAENIEGNGPKSMNHFMNHFGNFNGIPFLNHINHECFSGIKYNM